MCSSSKHLSFVQAAPSFPCVPAGMVSGFLILEEEGKGGTLIHPQCECGFWGRNILCIGGGRYCGLWQWLQVFVLLLWKCCHHIDPLQICPSLPALSPAWRRRWWGVVWLEVGRKEGGMLPPSSLHPSLPKQLPGGEAGCFCCAPPTSLLQLLVLMTF